MHHEEELGTSHGHPGYLTVENIILTPEPRTHPQDTAIKYPTRIKTGPHPHYQNRGRSGVVAQT